MTTMTTSTTLAPSTPAPPASSNGDVQPFFSTADVTLIRRTIAKEANDAEFEYFLKIASLRRLNPLTNQIYISIFNRNQPDKRNCVVQTTIHGLRLIADRTKRYVPGRAATFVTDDKGKLVSATAYVMRYHPESGTWHEVSDTAYWEEYNKSESLWKSMPHVMLAKCAEALALRRAFPEDTAGLYTDDEIAAPADGADSKRRMVDGSARPPALAAAPRMTPHQVKATWAEQNDRAEALEIAEWETDMPRGYTLGMLIDAIDIRTAALYEAEDQMRQSLGA